MEWLTELNELFANQPDIQMEITGRAGDYETSFYSGEITTYARRAEDITATLQALKYDATVVSHDPLTDEVLIYFRIGYTRDGQLFRVGE